MNTLSTVGQYTSSTLSFGFLERLTMDLDLVHKLNRRWHKLLSTESIYCTVKSLPLASKSCTCAQPLDQTCLWSKYKILGSERAISTTRCLTEAGIECFLHSFSAFQCPPQLNFSRRREPDWQKEAVCSIKKLPCRIIKKPLLLHVSIFCKSQA